MNEREDQSFTAQVLGNQMSHGHLLNLDTEARRHGSHRAISFNAPIYMTSPQAETILSSARVLRRD